MSANWSKGSTRRWRKIRAAVLAANNAANGGRCQVREKCDGAQATVVHHTVGRRVTGDDPRFLAASCAPCNLAIGDPAKTNPQPIRILP